MIMATPDPETDTARASALAAELRGLFGKLKRRPREQTDIGELTWSQMAVLTRLESENAATVTSLARAEGVRPQSMGATVAALETAGFIHGAPDPEDKRQTILSLSPECRAWIQAGRAARQDWLCRAIQTHLTTAEQDALKTAFALLNRLVAAAG